MTFTRERQRSTLKSLGLAFCTAVALSGTVSARAGGHQGNTSVRCESPVLGLTFRHPSSWTKADLGEALVVSNIVLASPLAQTTVSFFGGEWAASPAELRNRMMLADPTCSWHEVSQDGYPGFVCERTKRGRRVFWRPDGSVLRMDYSSPQELEVQGVIRTLHIAPNETPELEPESP